MDAFSYYKSRVPGIAANATLTDAYRSFYADNSGLTPKQNYSVSDHRRAFYVAANGAAPTLSLTQLELRYYAALGLDTSKGLGPARQLWYDAPLVIPDTTAPAVPFAFTATPANASALLEWDANTDDTTGYEIFKDNVLYGSQATDDAIVSPLTNGVSYSFKIRAFDAAGNRSAFTEAFLVTPVAPDTTAPSVPTGLGGTVGDTVVDLFWTASTDNVAVDSYTITKNGVVLSSVEGTTYRATGLTNGVAYTFAVRANDAAGNSSAYTSTISRTPVSSIPANWVKNWKGLGATPADGAILTGATVGSTSTGDTAFFSASSSPVIRKDNSGVSGAERCMIAVPNSTTATQWRWNDAALADFQIRFYIEVGGTIPTASTGVPLHATKTSGGQLFRLTIQSGNNRINILNAANAFVRSTPDVPPGLYRIEIWRDNAVDNLEFRMYNAATGAIFYSNSGLSTPLGVIDTLDDLIFGRQSGAAYGPWYFGAMVIGNNVGEIGYDPNYEVAPAVTYRDQTEHPFLDTSHWNVTLSTAVTTDSAASPKTANMIANKAKFTVNYTSWSVRRLKSTVAMPLVTLRRPGGGATWYTTFRIDPNFTPPLPSNGDRNSVIIQTDGVTAIDCYKLTKISDTIWESSSVDLYRLDGPGLQPGVRAASLPLIGGQIEQARINRVVAGSVDDFGHALAMSLPKEMLLATPTATDGVVVNSVAVQPATQQDNQANVPYSGNSTSGIAMGAFFCIPASVDILSLAPADNIEKALLYTLQRYGVYVTDQSSTIALYAELTLTSSQGNSLINAWKNKACDQLRRVTSNSAAGLYGGRPTGGTNTRLTPGEPLLPLNPNL